jgi:hemerythrin-like domain-containing protein
MEDIMSRCIETLMKEHQVILQVLGSLETWARQLEQEAPSGREPLSDFVAFFKNFADKCHHIKEEDFLFKKMNEAGFSNHSGPLAVMLNEHMLGRSFVSTLTRLADAQTPFSPTEVEEAIQNIRSYRGLLIQHIEKEDSCLFPMAERFLPAETLESLQGAFDAFEINVMGPQAHAQFHALADRLVAAFPPMADSIGNKQPLVCSH